MRRALSGTVATLAGLYALVALAGCAANADPSSSASGGEGVVTATSQASLDRVEPLRDVAPTAHLKETVAATRGITPEDRFVSNLYTDLLGRKPDGGKFHHLMALDRGASRAAVAAAILNGQEYRSVVVREIYRSLLGREIDSTGLSATLSYLAADGKVDQVILSVVRSEEYYWARGGGAKDLFIDQLYRDLLGRPPTGDELGKWIFGLTEGGETRASVARQLLGGDEYRRALVSAFFTTYLRRPVDEVSLGAFSGLLEAGMTRDQVLAAILGLPEYFARK